MSSNRNDRSVVVLAGGVGGARLAQGFAAIPCDLTVIVNIGDDDRIYGLWVSPDLDTVLYTLADRHSSHGWGLRDDTFDVMGHLGDLGEDTTFQLGDRDLATNLFRTSRLRSGVPLSSVTDELASAFGIGARLIPASDEAVPTRVRVGTEWISFQDYFVWRGHRDVVAELRYEGADESRPAPGVVAALEAASLVVIAPSNPPLSIWPILAIPGIRSAVTAAPRCVAVSPLLGGEALKGPADRVMAQLGLAPGNQGVADAYRDVITDLVIDQGDRNDPIQTGANVHATDTRIAAPDRARDLAEWLMELP